MSRGPDVVRMLTLIPWLLRRPGVSLDETAQAFGTDVGTIALELGHLDFCGLPGLGGGALFDVSIVDGAIHVRMADELRRPLRPTPVETLRLLLIARMAERVVGADVPALTSAIAKLGAALGVAPTAIDVIETDPGPLALTARRAIESDRCVHFEYRGRSDELPGGRRVEPWQLDLMEGAWYLHGFDLDAQAARIFRLDRASGLEIADEPRTRPIPEDLPAPRYIPGEDDLTVTLVLQQPALWLLDALTPDATLEQEAGTVVTLRTGAPEWLARLVLMAGGAAEVRAPALVRDLVSLRASDALRLAGRAARPVPAR
jgi:proteasome accessory factor C